MTIPGAGSTTMGPCSFVFRTVPKRRSGNGPLVNPVQDWPTTNVGTWT